MARVVSRKKLTEFSAMESFEGFDLKDLKAR